MNKVSRSQASQDVKMLEEKARICLEKKCFDEAECLLVQALKLREVAFGSGHRKLMPILNNLGLIYSECDKFDQAQAAYERALGIASSTSRADDFREMELLENYWKMLRKARQIEKADQVFSKLERLRAKNAELSLLSRMARHLTPSITMSALKSMEDQIDSQDRSNGRQGSASLVRKTALLQSNSWSKIVIIGLLVLTLIGLLFLLLR